MPQKSTSTRETNGTRPAETTRAPLTPRKMTLKRTQSNSELILKALHRKNGATLDELCKLTGWQRPSMRGFLSGTIKKKLALDLLSYTDEKGVRRYRIRG